MALVLLMAGTYAAYAAKQKADMAIMDESINVEGKTKVTLLDNEQLSLTDIPFCLINWFDGDYTTIRDQLTTRVEEILAKNPFLAGWLILDKDDNNKLTLIYDAAGQDMQQGIFKVYDDTALAEALQQDSGFLLRVSVHTNYQECTTQLLKAGVLMPLQHELIGKDHQPLLRISVIPDAEDPKARFALVLSMCHALGDAHTLYKILNMLSLNRDVETLIPQRDMEFGQHVRAKLGNDAMEYLKTAVRQPPVDLTENRNEPSVMKAFHVREEWFLKRDKRARRASMFANAANDYDTNDSVSENSILASWFFKLNQADIAFMGLSLRDRLDDCVVSDVHAGSYVAGIPYTPVDYATPTLIEQSVAKLKRCGGEGDDTIPLPAFRWNNSASISLNYACLFQEEIYLSPSCHQRNHIVLFDSAFLTAVPGRLSMCFMFTSVPGNVKDNAQANENSTKSAAEVAAAVAAQVEMEGGMDKTKSEDSTDTPGRRAGVLVLCRKSIWDQIEQSGIVDEILIDA